MTSESGTPRGEGTLPFGLFLFYVVGFFAIFLVWPEWRVNQLFVEGRCVVLDSRQREDPPGVFRGMFNGVFPPEFLIRYTVAGREYQTWTDDAGNACKGLRRPKEWVLERFTVGQEYPCWYDPADPSHVVLVRGYS